MSTEASCTVSPLQIEPWDENAKQGQRGPCPCCHAPIVRDEPWFMFVWACGRTEEKCRDNWITKIPPFCTRASELHQAVSGQLHRLKKAHDYFVRLSGTYAGIHPSQHEVAGIVAEAWRVLDLAHTHYLGGER